MEQYNDCVTQWRTIALVGGGVGIAVAIAQQNANKDKDGAALTYGLVGNNVASAGFGAEWINPDDPRQRASVALDPVDLDPKATYLQPLTESTEISLTLDASNVATGWTLRW